MGPLYPFPIPRAAAIVFSTPQWEQCGKSACLILLQEGHPSKSIVPQEGQV